MTPNSAGSSRSAGGSARGTPRSAGAVAAVALGRRRRELQSELVTVVAQQPQEPPGLPERVAPGLRDGPQRGGRRFGVPPDQVARDRGLDHHRAERVGERIVELRGDPLALRRRRALRGQAPLDAGVLGLRPQAAVAVERTEQRDAQRPRTDAQDQPEEEVGLERR